MMLLLTIDSLRSDRFNKDCFPNCWSRFQSDFATFTQCYSHGGATPFAFPAIHTGEDLEGDGTLSQAETLAEAEQGLSIGRPNNPQLGAWRGYDRGFTQYGESCSSFEQAINKLKSIPRRSARIRQLYNSFLGDTEGESLGYKPANKVVKTALGDIAQSPELYWTHFMDPHYPFVSSSVPDAENKTEYSSRELDELNEQFADANGRVERLSRDEIATLRRVYDENIRFLDRQLNWFFEELEQRGVYQDALIAVTADHGEAFGEQGVFNHQWNAIPIDELIQVPLLIKLPQTERVGEFDHIVGHKHMNSLLHTFLTTEEDPAEDPLFVEEDRVVVSKSNTAMRAISASGEITREKEGRVEMSGNVTEDLESKMRLSKFPSVPSLGADDAVDGQAVGNNDVKNQLEQLGYLEK